MNQSEEKFFGTSQSAKLLNCISDINRAVNLSSNNFHHKWIVFLWIPCSSRIHDQVQFYVHHSYSSRLQMDYISQQIIHRSSLLAAIIFVKNIITCTIASINRISQVSDICDKVVNLAMQRNAQCLNLGEVVSS